MESVQGQWHVCLIRDLYWVIWSQLWYNTMGVCVCVFERDREEHTQSQNETILDTTDRRTIWIYSVVFLFIFSPKWHSCLFHHNFCLFYLFVAGHWLVTHLYLTHLINLNSVPQTYCLLISYEFWPLSYSLTFVAKLNILNSHSKCTL